MTHINKVKNYFRAILGHFKDQGKDTTSTPKMDKVVTFSSHLEIFDRVILKRNESKWDMKLPLWWHFPLKGDGKIIILWLNEL